MSRLVERGWLRRNAVALGVLALALGAMIAVAVVIPYRTWADDHRPPPRVAAGSTARLGEARFRIEKVGLFHRDGKPGVDVPKGAMVLAVLVRVRTAERIPRFCTLTLVREGTDPISWDALESPSEYGYGLSDTTDHQCLIDEHSGSRLIEETYLVPESVYGHVTLEVRTSPEKDLAGTSETVALELPKRPYSDTAG